MSFEIFWAPPSLSCPDSRAKHGRLLHIRPVKNFHGGSQKPDGMWFDNVKFASKRDVIIKQKTTHCLNGVPTDPTRIPNDCPSKYWGQRRANLSVEIESTGVLYHPEPPHQTLLLLPANNAPKAANIKQTHVCHKNLVWLKNGATNVLTKWFYLF